MTAAVMPVRAVTCLGLLAAALACTGLPLHSAEPPPLLAWAPRFPLREVGGACRLHWHTYLACLS